MLAPFNRVIDIKATYKPFERKYYIESKLLEKNLNTMIELGGNIKLNGFNDLDPATLIVVKKIVGNYTKKLTEQHPDFIELLLNMNKNEKIYTLSVSLSKKSGSIISDAKAENLFFALSSAFEKINK